MNVIDKTAFNFDGQIAYYKGKVREVYYFEDLLVSIVSDRISAFDHILPKPIPYKGQVLNQIAAYFLNASRDIVPNWLISCPHPNVSIGYKCKPIKLEMVVRAYLAGHAARIYAKGERMICGVKMPEGLKEGDKLETPIITPATKAEEGHDEDIDADKILRQKIVTKEVWEQLCKYSLELFDLGTRMAAQQGLILVDTKYEFGFYNDELMLIDEIHTPDSSRYYIKEGYLERQDSHKKQTQLSKEFVREWLMSNGFQGKEGQKMPFMPDDFVQLVSNRYIALFEKITGENFTKKNAKNLEKDIEQSILNFLNNN